MKNMLIMLTKGCIMLIPNDEKSKKIRPTKVMELAGMLQVFGLTSENREVRWFVPLDENDNIYVSEYTTISKDLYLAELKTLIKKTIT